MEQSGWSTLRQELVRRYHWTRNAFHLKEEWLVQELLRQLQLLLECLEAGQGLPHEERIALADLQALAQEAGAEPPPPLKAVPWCCGWNRSSSVPGNWWRMRPSIAQRVARRTSCAKAASRA